MSLLAHDQRRGSPAPEHDGRLFLGRNAVLLQEILFPNGLAGRAVEARQMAAGAQGEDHAVVDGGRASRPHARLHSFIAARSRMRPFQPTRLDVVTRCHFHVAPLLHGHRMTVHHGECRPARADLLPPNQLRGPIGPIAGQLDVIDGLAAVRPEKTREIVFGRRAKVHVHVFGVRRSVRQEPATTDRALPRNGTRRSAPIRR